MGFGRASWPFDVLLFATLFIFGDKKVVHDVSRQEGWEEPGRGHGTRGTFAMPQRDLAMELVVSENFVPTVRSPWFVLFFSSYTVLNFWNSKSNIIPSSLLCDRRGRQVSGVIEK